MQSPVFALGAIEPDDIENIFLPCKAQVTQIQTPYLGGYMSAFAAVKLIVKKREINTNLIIALS
jgi:hypothetical protein